MSMDGGHPRSVQTVAGEVSIEAGQVLLDGPGGIAVTMTPAAAAETGRRLLAAADRIATQSAG